MDELQIHQNHALLALKVMSELCEKNGIEYYLIAGSCLGAIRHHGFIPWDDDIDIGIKYEDEKKLEQLLSNNLPSNYSYKSMYLNPDYPRLHGKILFEGRTCIDIFPLIKLSDNEHEAKRQWKRRRLLEKLYYRKIGYVHEGERKSIVLISKIVSFFISKERIFNMLKKNAYFCSEKATRNWINIYSIYSMEKEMIRSDHLLGGQPVIFEGITVNTVNAPHQYLEHLYGDYMTLPPAELRHPAHSELF